jgi:hypothetical protein
MSKKIAQLTKVIYHLNNKNEDHDHDLADVSEQYETVHPKPGIHDPNNSKH